MRPLCTVRIWVEGKCEDAPPEIRSDIRDLGTDFSYVGGKFPRFRAMLEIYFCACGYFPRHVEILHGKFSLRFLKVLSRNLEGSQQQSSSFSNSPKKSGTRFFPFPSLKAEAGVGQIFFSSHVCSFLGTDALIFLLGLSFGH